MKLGRIGAKLVDKTAVIEATSLAEYFSPLLGSHTDLIR